MSVEYVEQLGVAERTVKQHMHRIFRKLGVPSRYSLILSTKVSHVRAAQEIASHSPTE